MEAFHYRYHPHGPPHAPEIVDEGELGPLRHIEAWLCAPIPNKSDIRYQSRLAGGAMMDMGSYVVHGPATRPGGAHSAVSATAKLHSPDVDRAMKAELQFPSWPHGHRALLDVVPIDPPPGGPGGRGPGVRCACSTRSPPRPPAG
jgi:predicted dehydrogenase